jgi:uncharacterized protein (TIRG00374 family)
MTRSRLIKYAVALALLAFVIWRSDPGEIWDVLKSVDAGTIGVVVLLNIPVAAGVALRSFLVLRRMGHDVPARVVLPASVLGAVAGTVTPAASGEALRALSLRAHAGVPVEDSVALVVYERVLALYLLALSTLVFLALTSLAAAPAALVTLFAVSLLGLPWLVATRLPASRLGRFFQGEAPWAKAARYVLALAAQLRLTLSDLPLLLAWSVITIGGFAITTLQVALLNESASADVLYSDTWVAFGASQLAGILSLLPLGLGVADGSLAALLDRAGATLEQGTTVAVLVRAAVTLPLVLLGFLSYLYLNRTEPAEKQAGPVPSASER